MHSEEWQHGYTAAGTGADVTANPYEPGRPEFDEWAEGFAQYHIDNP